MRRRADGGPASAADPGKGTGRREPGRVRVRSLAARGLAAGLLAASAALLVLPSQALAQNSAPTFDDGTDTSPEFNETIGDATVTTASDIGAAITATDTDTGDTLEYTLGGTDAAKFGIISTSGQIQTKVDETYSYETKTSYDVTVTVEDGNGGSATIDVMLNVVNQDEPPLRPAAPMVSGPASNSTTSLRVVMTAPDNSGRPPITHYRVRAHRDGFGWSNLPYSPNSAKTIANITSGKRYHVQFRVKNDEGESDWSPTGFGYTKAHASGMPDISGTARVGRTLTAGTSEISDRNGKSKAENGEVGFAYTYQWVRVDGGTETNILGETASTYTLAMADLGKTVKVTASFTDNVGYAEGPLTSDAYPSSGTVALLELSFAENIVNVDEDAGSATLTVGLAPAGTEMVTVDYATRDSGAEAGEDYTATSGTLTFAPGETSETITILITDDNIYEDLESFFLDLSDPSGTALPAIPTRAVEIASDDEPTASMDDVTVDEGAGTMTLTLHLSHPSHEEIAYVASSSNVAGTATEVDDYDDFLPDAGRTAKLTVPGGDLSQTFDITIVDDNLEEPDETIELLWRKQTSHAVTPQELVSIGTIKDNDEGAGAAMGKLRITGAVEVGQMLTVSTSGLTDQHGNTKAENGDTGFAYTYQWYRVDAGAETEIPGATGSTYTQVQADEGKGIRVRVSFTDDAGNAETLASDVYRAVVILPAPRLPSVDDPNAIWMATLTVANLGSNRYGYDASEGGGLTDTGFTYLGDDTPLSGGTYREVGTLYTIDELFYHTGTGKLVLSLDVEFVGGSAANIFVDVGGTQRSFSQANPASNPYTFTFPNPSWSVGDEVTVKIVVLEQANGPEDLRATSAESSDGFDVTLTWDAPTDAVTGYRVEHQPDPALQWRTLAASQSGTTYADSGLGRGTVRYYRVAALRSGGASYSEIVRVQAPSETEEVPEKVNHVDVKPAEGSDTALEVAWNRPRTPNSRALATGYHVQYVQHDGAAPAVRDGEDWATVTFPTWMERLPWQTWSGAVEEIEFEESTESSAHLKTVVTGLAPGTNYRVRVRGCTEADCGEWSYPRRWTTSGTALNATEAEPLTATLEDFPTNHDGSSAFTFRIAFSAEVTISRQDMKEHALTVTGGTVTHARRVDRRKDLWELTLEPAGTGAVSILVPQDRACTETGALCTAEGAMLSPGLGHSVPGPVAQGQQGPAPLAAGFVAVPPEHDGETEFWLELSFGAAVEQGSKPRIQALLGVTGGSETRMRRKDGRLDHWRIRIQPSSHEAVTVTLSPSPACGAAGAVCTEDGRTFTTALATRIQGPPGLAVADAEVQEAANASLDFAVTLSRPPSGTVTVDYATSDGTATAGSDYTATSGTLAFAAGETEKTVSVPVLDDAHDEGSETLTLTLSNPSGAYLADGTATGTINNSDLMPQAWLARFGRTVADQVMEAVEGRVTAARTPGTALTVAGQAFGSDAAADPEEMREAEARLERLATWFRGGDDEESAGLFETRAVTGREVLAGTSFALTEGTAESGLAGLWGRGAVTRFDGREGDLTLDGEVESALLGADWARGRWTAGLALGHSQAEGGYRSPQGDGAVESTLTGVYPYGRYDVNDWLSLWGVVGYGTGSLTLTPAGKTPIETDMDLRLAALGGRSVLVAAPADGGLELAATSDAMVVQTTSDEVRGSVGRSLAASEAEVTRIRLGLEGAWRGIGSIVPSFEIGVRQDGGDAETGFGADIGAGLAWSDPAHGIAADVRARGLLTHEDSSFRERGFAGSFAWDPDPASDLGPSLTLRQTVGASATGGADALLAPESAQALIAANDEEDDVRNRRLEATLGYGIPAFGGRYTTTPAIGFGLTEAEREYSHSWRLAEAKSAGLVFGLDVEGTRRESVTDGSGPEHLIGFGLGWRLEGARREGFELRLEGSRLDAANDDRAPEDRIGLRMSARW